jgi:hypothetical protein
MKIPNKEVIERIKNQYPTGARVELVFMDDPQAPPIGTLGTVKYVDDLGDIGVAWDNGSNLNIVYDIDCCKVVED